MKDDCGKALWGVFCVGFFVGLSAICAGMEKFEALAVGLVGVIGFMLFYYPAIVRTIKWLRAKGE